MFVSFFIILFLFFFFFGVYFVSYYSIFLEFPFSFTYFFDSSFVFQFDMLSFFFFSFVSFISGMVFLYSKFYMMEKSFFLDLDNSRFYYLVFFFVFSMFFLVFSGSWFTVLLGWDGLGVVSFLLVIYFNDSFTLNSGLVTILSNRIGDCFFIISFMFFFFVGWPCQDFLLYSISLFFFIFIFLGCITKSAQVPFSAWLPAAMSAPTPVSSLVHSSTLVTAGIYVLMRFNFLFIDYYFIILVFSLLTMFFAGVCAIWERDFKKVVAMSTLSQLGFILFSLAMGMTMFSFCHMVFHAFFKSSLFLATGNLMHYLSGTQDSRFFGSMGSSFMTKIIFSVSCMSLMGFPFSLGFYSKDTILGFVMFNSLNLFSVIFFLSCVFTVSYSIRLMSLVFFYFPTFYSSVSFKDYSYYFFSVSSLYFFCVFLGNSFFFFFSIPSTFSIVDTFFGLVLILLGFMFYYLSKVFFVLENFVGSIGFISLLLHWSSSLMMANVLYKVDFSWSEMFSYSFVYYLKNIFTYLNIILFISLYFFVFFMSYFLLFF